ncbi:hypothetical protein HBI46_197660 [Parastagonospora nodorum]|nr:hypothetical protein HBH72_000890 [Parastagonospora nodorum]KAH5405349.1 hypothetical protein HBI46_197660 [Parastagonospora nodorum]
MNASYSPIPFQNFAMYSATRSMPLMLTHLPLPNCLSNNLPPLHPLLPILPRRTLISLPLHRQQRLPPCIKPRTPDQPRRRNERETLHPRHKWSSKSSISPWNRPETCGTSGVSLSPWPQWSKRTMCALGK